MIIFSTRDRILTVVILLLVSAAGLPAFFKKSTSKSGLVDISTLDPGQVNIEVRKLFASKCIKCHNSVKHKAALILDTKEGIFAGGENGPVVISGDSKNSEMIRRLRLPARHEDAMPPEGDRLTKQEIDLVAHWIDLGTPWADTTLKLFREAPLTLTVPEIPDEKDFSHPVDRFMRSYFRKNNQRWPQKIDDGRFIRKVYLDVLGLLPSPLEIEKFLASADPEKYSRLVNRLLSEENDYTLHWLSFWNDLLRNDYTGTGYITGGRQQISEWLYCALYENKAYSEMVRELLNPEEQSAGFIRGIEWRGVVNASQRTELQAAQNVSQSLMGLNLKCASCHNSFVNNVTLDQAYGFANIFADTTLEIYQCDKPTGRFTTPSFIYPELGQVASDSLKDRLLLLAETAVKKENGRLYRTLVNRYWDRLWGIGLVPQVDDMDKESWNADLLDWLANYFYENNTDLKKLLHLLLTSETYRLEPFDYGSQELIDWKKFIFKGPSPRRLSAEQFVDAFSQFIYPFYFYAHFSLEKPPGDPLWMWHEEIEVDRRVLPKPGERWYRRKFDLKDPENIKEVSILIQADSSYLLSLNHEKLLEGNDYRITGRKKVDVSLLKKKNILTIHAANDGEIANPAGILFAMKISYENQDTIIRSDTFWVSTDTMPMGAWEEYDYLDTTWHKVRTYGRLGPFGYPPQFQWEERSTDHVRASISRQDPFMLTLGRPTRENVTSRRSDEATLLQALLLSNDEHLAENIRRGAKRWMEKSNLSLDEKIRDLFYGLTGRIPTKKELLLLTEKIKTEDHVAGWEDVIWSICMLPEFLLI